MTIKPTHGLLSARCTPLGTLAMLIELEFDHPVEFATSMVESHPQMSIGFKDETCTHGEVFRVIFAEPANDNEKDIIRGVLFGQTSVGVKRTIFRFVRTAEWAANVPEFAKWVKA